MMRGFRQEATDKVDLIVTTVNNLKNAVVGLIVAVLTIALLMIGLH
jgi:uncharacterized membrane protein YqhA